MFGSIGAMVTLGLVLQLILSLTADASDGSFESAPARIVNFFSFFTVWSNIAVAVSSWLLAARPFRPSTAFRVLRIDAVLCIAVTGIVFHLALSDIQELTGWGWVADRVLHLLSPVAAVAAWILIGPRGQLSPRIVGLSVIGPVLWLVYALIRGAIVEDRFGNHYYAYPFMNVEIHGYATALLRCAIVAALFLVLAFGAMLLDRRLRGLRTTSP